MQLTPDSIGLLIQALQFLWTVSLTVFVAFSRADAGIKNKVELLEKDLNGVGQRVRAVETRIEDGIGQDDIDAIHKRNHEDLRAVHLRVDDLHKLLSDISSKIGEVSGKLDGMRNNR